MNVRKNIRSGPYTDTTCPMKKAVSIGIYSTLWISFLIWSVLCVSKVTSLPEDPNEVVQKDEKTDNDYKQEVEIAAPQHKEVDINMIQ